MTLTLTLTPTLAPIPNPTLTCCQVFQGFRVNPGPLESGTLALGMPQPSPASKIQALLVEEGITELWQLPKILQLKLKPFGQNNANNLWPNQWEALQAA